MNISIYSFLYRNIVKQIFFQIDPESVHNFVTVSGELIGKSNSIKKILKKSTVLNSQYLEQDIEGIHFSNPIGLAAGFDYDARLTQILPALGFGFETIGTITNLPYDGNTKPRLGRLPKSRSLMVNKGFKNRGAIEISDKTSNLRYEIPLGVSIGKTNSLKLKTQEESIDDIIKAITVFENSNTSSSYYELNISCPNLHGNITFYPPRNLDQLLKEVDKLNLNKPVFIKMPIDKRNSEVIKMLDVISRHRVKGVIFGNLQKNRNNPELNRDELSKFNKGYFSGKPTEKRSNELISLAYKNFGKKFIIIGCGGVFNAKDAYRKIKLGASLVQLITGLVYEGPLLVSEINKELINLLKRDGYRNIKLAIGKGINT